MTDTPHQAAERGHSPLGFSGMHRWATCPGSIRLCRDIPNTGSDAADEGTAAHEVFAACALEKTDAWTWIGREVEVAGRMWPVTEEMAAAVQVALDVVAEFGNGSTLIEYPVAADHISDQLWGTADCIHVGTDGVLTILDYKHGEGVHVEAVGNPQVLGYASAARRTLNLAAKPKTIRCIIVQPRDRNDDIPVRVAEISAADLDKWEQDVLRPAVEAVARPDAPLNPSGKACQFCAAKLVCPAARGVVEEAAAVDPEIISLEDLGQLIGKAEVAAAVLRAAKNKATAAIKEGQAVPGWKLEAGKGNRIWKEKAEETLKETFGDAIYTEPALKSPAQVEKLSASAKKVVANLAFSPVGNPKLVPASEAGEDWKPETPETLFAGKLKAKQ